MGTGAFGNYDRSAQSGGMPSLARVGTHEAEEEQPHVGVTHHTSHQHHHTPSHDADAAVVDPEKEKAQGDGVEVSRTRTTSVTEAGGDNEASHKEERGKTPDTETSEDDEAIEEARRDSMVQALARKYTSQSQYSGPVGDNPFQAAAEDLDSPLNPNSPHFKARAWATSIVNMVSSEGHQFRTSGVAFQNMNVFGFGVATDYQKDVGNVWLEAVGLVRRLFGNGKRRIDILRSFDGVVKKGEMLVVLGPPGSGCSTFLKTIAGEHNGIFVDDNSYFNYQGKCVFKIYHHHITSQCNWQ